MQKAEFLQFCLTVNLPMQSVKCSKPTLLSGTRRRASGSEAGSGISLYVVSFVVNKYSNEVSEIDILYSANAKKEPAALLPKITDKTATPTDSTISVAQLLDSVNDYFPDILPERVLRHFGYEARPDGLLGKNALYQQRQNTLTDREVLEFAASQLESSELSEGERDALER